MNIEVYSNNKLVFDGKTYPCAIGKSGVYVDHREGDWSSPAGCFALRRVFWRPDKGGRPQTVLETREIKTDDGWCDDSNCESYNQLVKLPHKGSHENMSRPDDDLYDIVVELGHNDDPVVPGMGSAIFIHVARPAMTPTAGCVALKKSDLYEVLSKVTSKTQICIHTEPLT